MMVRSASRRRRPDPTTTTACLECRKKRTKCDGQAQCEKCVTAGVTCIYEASIRKTKETLRAELNELQNHRQLSERVFGAISSGPDAQTALDRLRNGETLEAIADWLDKTEPRTSNISKTITSTRQDEQPLLGLANVEVERPHRTTWTDITQDVNMVEDIVELYFCWEYPIFASISKKHFLADFRAGSGRQCSSLLVNAMLALGCRFLDLKESVADLGNSIISGDRFFVEARRQLSEDDLVSLTTIQALCVMSIREASCGKESEGFYYAGQAIRLAVEAGLHLEATDHGAKLSHDKEEETRGAIFWGAFALDQIWSLILGTIPYLSRFPILLAKPPTLHNIEFGERTLHIDEGISEMSINPAAHECFWALTQLVHCSLYAVHVPGSCMSTQELLALHIQYLQWYDSLPEPVRLGQDFTPAVLFLHMYYHFAILLLFRPFLKCPFGGSRVSPYDVCSEAADAIAMLVRSYDRLYTLRRAPTFVPYFVLASCIFHLIRIASTSSGLNQFCQGIKDLKDMCVCHGSAQRALNILRVLAARWDTRDVPSRDSPPVHVKDVHFPSSMSLDFYGSNLDDNTLPAARSELVRAVRAISDACVGLPRIL